MMGASELIRDYEEKYKKALMAERDITDIVHVMTVINNYKKFTASKENYYKHISKKNQKYKINQF